MMTILLTGPTGTIGSKVMKAIIEKPDVCVRAGVRSAEKAAALRRGNVTPVDLDFNRPESVAAALEGVDRAFLLPPNIPNQGEVATRFIDLAKAAGVRHVVKLSGFGCELEPSTHLRRGHRAVEKHRELGAAVDAPAPEQLHGELHQLQRARPAGGHRDALGAGGVQLHRRRGRRCRRCRRLDDGGSRRAGLHADRTGGVTLAQVAELLGLATGRTIRYVDVTESAFREALLGQKMPPPHVEALLEMHAFDRAGRSAGVTSTVRNLLGRRRRASRASPWRTRRRSEVGDEGDPHSTVRRARGAGARRRARAPGEGRRGRREGRRLERQPHRLVDPRGGAKSFIKNKFPTILGCELAERSRRSARA